MAFVVPGILSAFGLLLVMLSGWLWLRSAHRHLCPGPTLRWRARLNPIWIAYHPRCAYDLSGHTPDSNGAIVCPECGRHVHRRSQMLRTARAFHPGRLGCALIVGGLLIYRYPPLAATTVVQYTPTNMLLRGEGMLGVGTPLEVRDEIRRRAMAYELDDSQLTRFVRLLVNDLRDDQLVGNAKDALEQLVTFGAFCQQPLLDALNSEDSQQRRLASHVLRRLPLDGEVPEAILRVSIEDLKSDDRRWNAYGARWYLRDHLEAAKPLLIEAMHSDDAQQRCEVKNLLRSTQISGEAFADLLRMSIEDLNSKSGRSRASGGFDYLLAHAEAAEPLLVDGMRSADDRQRLLCATLAGCAQRMDLMPLATPILVEHLANNRIDGDAIVAARALAGFGVDVVPLLQEFRASTDEQQRQAVEYIVRRLTTDESPIALQRELPLARLTYSRRDALEIPPESLHMPDF